MTGPTSSDSWRQFGSIKSAGRSEAWNELLSLGGSHGLKSPIKPLFGDSDDLAPLWKKGSSELPKFPNLHVPLPSSTPTSNFNLGSSPWEGKREGSDPSQSTMGTLLTNEAYRRAALDFVLELTGPESATSAVSPTHEPNDFIYADDLPVPAFAVDKDARVTMWNSRLQLLSGWGQPELLSGEAKLTDLFKPTGLAKTGSAPDITMLLHTALFEKDLSSSAGSSFWLSPKGTSQGTTGPGSDVLRGSAEGSGIETCDGSWLASGQGSRRGGSCRAGWAWQRGPAAHSQGPVLQLCRGSNHTLALAACTSAAGGDHKGQKLDLTASAPSSRVAVRLHMGQRRDAVGAVKGVLCVVVPLSVSESSLDHKAAQSAVDRPVLLRHVDSSSASLRSSDFGSEELTAEEGGRGRFHGRPSAGLPGGTAASASAGSLQLEGPGWQYRHRRTLSAMPRYAIPADSTAQQDTAPSSAASSTEDLCGSNLSAGSVSSGAQLVHSDSCPSVRALVMESVDAVRNDLIQNLERCGVDVVAASSLREAMWRFEQALSEPPTHGPRFDVLFLELQANGDESLLAIRDLRRLEEEANMAQLPGTGTGAASQWHRVTGAQGHRDTGAQGHRDTGAASAGRHEAAEEAEREEGGSKTEALAREEDGSRSSEADEHHCLIVVVVNLNRWDLAGLDVAMEQCVRAGGDAVIPRSMHFQQLRTALRKLGIRSKYLMFPSRLPRALSGPLHNPLNITR